MGNNHKEKRRFKQGRSQKHKKSNKNNRTDNTVQSSVSLQGNDPRPSEDIDRIIGPTDKPIRTRKGVAELTPKSREAHEEQYRETMAASYPGAVLPSTTPNNETKDEVDVSASTKAPSKKSSIAGTVRSFLPKFGGRISPSLSIGGFISSNRSSKPTKETVTPMTNLNNSSGTVLPPTIVKEANDSGTISTTSSSNDFPVKDPRYIRSPLEFQPTDEVISPIEHEAPALDTIGNDAKKTSGTIPAAAKKISVTSPKTVHSPIRVETVLENSPESNSSNSEVSRLTSHASGTSPDNKTLEEPAESSNVTSNVSSEKSVSFNDISHVQAFDKDMPVSDVNGNYDSFWNQSASGKKSETLEERIKRDLHSFDRKLTHAVKDLNTTDVKPVDGLTQRISLAADTSMNDSRSPNTTSLNRELAEVNPSKTDPNHQPGMRMWERFTSNNGPKSKSNPTDSHGETSYGNFTNWRAHWSLPDPHEENEIVFSNAKDQEDYSKKSLVPTNQASNTVTATTTQTQADNVADSSGDDNQGGNFPGNGKPLGNPNPNDGNPGGHGDDSDDDGDGDGDGGGDGGNDPSPNDEALPDVWDILFKALSHVTENFVNIIDNGDPTSKFPKDMRKIGLTMVKIVFRSIEHFFSGQVSWETVHKFDDVTMFNFNAYLQEQMAQYLREPEALESFNDFQYTVLRMGTMVRIISTTLPHFLAHAMELRAKQFLDTPLQGMDLLRKVIIQVLGDYDEQYLPMTETWKQVLFSDEVMSLGSFRTIPLDIGDNPINMKWKSANVSKDYWQGNRSDPLQTLQIPPPHGYTHFDGRWIPDTTKVVTGWVWALYAPKSCKGILEVVLPSNVPTTNDHWAGRWHNNLLFHDWEMASRYFSKVMIENDWWRDVDGHWRAPAPRPVPVQPDAVPKQSPRPSSMKPAPKKTDPVRSFLESLTNKNEESKGDVLFRTATLGSHVPSHAQPSPVPQVDFSQPALVPGTYTSTSQPATMTGDPSNTPSSTPNQPQVPQRLTPRSRPYGGPASLFHASSTGSQPSPASPLGSFPSMAPLNGTPLQSVPSAPNSHPLFPGANLHGIPGGFGGPPGGPPPGGPGGPNGPHGNRYPLHQHSSYHYGQSPYPTKSSFKVKYDITQFPTLRNPASWIAYNEELQTQFVVTGLADVLNPYYQTNPYHNPTEFRQMSAMVFNALSKTIRFPQGMSIVKRHLHTMDGGALYRDLADHCLRSPIAEITMDNLRSKLTSARLTGHAGSYEKWITGWLDDAYNYNNNVVNPDDRITDSSLKKYLCIAVEGVRDLSHVRQRELENLALTGRLYTYDEYCTALLAIGQQLDQSSIRPRHAHNHIRESDDRPEGNSDECDLDPQDLLIHEARRRSFGPRLNKDTWDALPPTDQTAWDTLSDEAKGKILAYKQQRDTQRASSRSVNQHLSHDPSADDDTPVSTEPLSDLKINETKGTTHPGNVNRVLSDKGAAVKGTKKSVSINLANTVTYPSDRQASMAIRLTHTATREQVPQEPPVPQIHDDDNSVVSRQSDALSFAFSDNSSTDSVPPPLLSGHPLDTHWTSSRQPTGYDSDHTSDSDTSVPPLISRHNIYSIFDSDDDDDNTVDTCVSTDSEHSTGETRTISAYSVQHYDHFYEDSYCDDVLANSVQHGEFYCDDALVRAIPAQPTLSSATSDGEISHFQTPTPSELQSKVWQDAVANELNNVFVLGTVNEVEVASTTEETVTTGGDRDVPEWQSYQGWTDWFKHHQFSNNHGETHADDNGENDETIANGESNETKNTDDGSDFR